MSTRGQADRLVVVHGEANAQTLDALRAAGLAVVAEVDGVTVWGPLQHKSTTAEPTDEPRRLLLTVSEAAALLGVGRTTAYELISRHELEVVHLGRAARVPLAAVEDLVQRLRRPSGSHQVGTMDSLGSADASQLDAASSPPPADLRGVA